jgi:hypothetical protein
MDDATRRRKGIRGRRRKCSKETLLKSPIVVHM